MNPRIWAPSRSGTSCAAWSDPPDGCEATPCAAVLSRWQETQGADGSNWLAEPCADRPPVGWQLRAKGPRMGRQRSVVRPAVCHDQPGRRGCRVPAPLACDFLGETALSIERAHELADVHEFCLQLDHEHGSGGWMPGRDVDDAPLSVHGERHLGFCDPAAELAEDPSYLLVHGRMTRIEQAAQVAALPSDVRVDPCVEGTSHLPYCPEREARQGAPLDSAQRRARHARLRRKVALPPAPALANAPDRGTDLVIVHGRQSCQDRSSATYFSPPSPATSEATASPGRRARPV